MRIKKLAFVFFLSVVAAIPAFSQSSSKPLMAYCTLEKGCSVCQSGMSYDELDRAFNYLGTYAKNRGILTFFTNKNGEDTHYPDRTRTPTQLNRYFGGKGEPSVLNSCTLAFPASIQPNDGHWSIATSKPTTVNCPAGTEEQLSKIKMFQNGPKVFSKPFRPQDLLDDPNVKWSATNLNRYRALYSGADNNFETTYDVKVTSPNSMEGDLNFFIKIPGRKVCQVNIDFTYRRSE